VMITVLPQPSPSANAQPGSGGWTLNATSTLKRNDGKVTADGSSTTVAQLTVAGGQVKGQGQLNISLDMKAGEANCHGDGSPTPFTVSGTQDAGMLHLTLTGANASMTVTVTCNNGMSLPFPLPAGWPGAPRDDWRGKR